MKSSIKKIFIQFFKKNKNEETNSKPLYEDLTAENNVKNNHYLEAIEWALKNDNIKNVALTGPYGSGKSSIINSFEKSNKNNYNFLNISLATFSDTHNDKQLEQSILQQIFYKVKEQEIPFSRFKRIKHIKINTLFTNFIFLLLFIVSLIYLYNPNLLIDTYNNTYLNKSFDSTNTTNHIISVLLLSYILFYLLVLVKSVFVLIKKSIKLNQITISNATLDINTAQDQNSIFDKYIDEILYFFKATNYNVIVFEDLDRFNSLDIFERLRELNLLINNSDEVKQRVIFIYAIRDDIFGQKDDISYSRNRTKFFDFIIPVIPIINSFNSGEILKEKLRKTPWSNKLSDDLINDITIYIDDMRILKNIYNEFILFIKNLGDIDLNLNNLLSIIVYKNIYPIDYALLQFNKGIVYEVFSSKYIFIENAIKELQEEIDELEIYINRIENETLESIHELESAYVEALGLYINNSHYNYWIQIDGQNYNLNNAKNLFTALSNAKKVHCYLPSVGNRGSTVEEIATVFGSKTNFFDRKDYILQGIPEKIEEINKTIAHKKNELARLSSFSLKDLINKHGIEKFFSPEYKQMKLLIYLIRNGYIDEMYDQYMSYFYPGSVTKEDIKFILSVKDQEALPFNFKLTNLDKLFERLNVANFQRVEILNFDLLDYLMENINNSKYKIFFDLIIIQLTNESPISFDFINKYIHKTNHKELFVKSLCANWNNFWSFINQQTSLTLEEKNYYLSCIIDYANHKDIILMNNNHVLTKSLSTNNDFLKLFPSKNYSKTENILLELDVKFENLINILKDEKIFNFIYKNNLYEINSQNLSILNDNNYDYTSIQTSDKEFLIDYINQNINSYVINIPLSLSKLEESEETIIHFYNNDEIERNNKLELIKLQQINIKDITEVEKNLWDTLIKYNKLDINWSNVINIFLEDNLSTYLIDYLNIPEIYHNLHYKTLDECPDFNEKLLYDLSMYITKNQNINEITFEYLVNSLCNLDLLNSDELVEISEQRLALLISKQIISLNKTNFTMLKSLETNLHIKLIEENKLIFLEDIREYNLDYLDYFYLLNSNRFLIDEKIHIIKSIKIELLNENMQLIILISDFIISNHVTSIDFNILLCLVGSEIEAEIKLKLFILNINNLDKIDITNILNQIGIPYSEITENRKRPKLEITVIHKELLIALDAVNYISKWKEEENALRVYNRMNIEG